MQEIKVDKVYFNSNALNNLEQKISHYAREKYKLKENETLRLGNYKFISIGKKDSDENTGSTVLLGAIKDITLLFMGDASIKSEKYLLENYDLPQVTILKVGHHGSRTSTSQEFIDKINPQYALISAGIDNKFNHPHREIVKRLENNNTIIYDIRTNKIKTNKGGNI